MELALNLFWLLLSLASLAVWRLHWSRARTGRWRRHGSLRGLTALVCALVFLFPVISLTDDLHFEQLAIEDSSATHKHLIAMKGQHTSGNPLSRTFSAASVELFKVFQVGHLVRWFIVPADNLHGNSSPIPSCEGRAPPLAPA